MSKNEKAEDKKTPETSVNETEAKVEALSPEEVAELRRQLAEKEEALQQSEGARALLSTELSFEKSAREKLEAENRKLDKHAALVEKSELKRLQNEEKITINIAEGEGADGKDDVFASVNAVPYQIKRGVDVPVPMSIYKVLRDASYTMREVHDEGDGNGVTYRERQVPRYNIRVAD
ncbi:hypothetical protein [Maridesulfovibrio sp.]|uniref:hypothetical protein n=1 Tax=Maridesulfovibrio sp. TaxID=2795000 RepID=UPI002AA725E8|nr:hypothetical protein [Maridesulfovibrio sp.]